MSGILLTRQSMPEQASEIFEGVQSVASTMIFQKTKLSGVVEVRLDPRSDERGFFARSWCEREFANHGLNPRLAQCNVSQVLCPRLRPGQVLIMDHLAAHKVAGVRELIAATGARLLYLPPYSPDFNPIEQAWSKIQQLLRSAKARSVAALEQAIAEVLAAITPGNASAWFAHCNYGLQ
jgi:hypothetical protein